MEEYFYYRKKPVLKKMKHGYTLILNKVCAKELGLKHFANHRLPNHLKYLAILNDLDN